MSELGTKEYGRQDILDITRWIDYRDGIVHLLDPATGDPLRTDAPPLWLANDDRLAKGYDALGEPEHDHDLTIAFSRHKDATDLGRFENRFTWFERTYARSHALAFEEGMGWDRTKWHKVLQDLRARPSKALAESPGFTERLLRSAVRHQHVLEFSYDLENTARPIDKLLLEMIHPRASFSRLQGEAYPIQKILKFAAGALREWYFPGKYMYEFMQLDLPPSPRTLLTVGAGHADLTRKFRVLGFSPNERHFPLSKDRKRDVETHSRAMREGRIDFQVLGALSLG